MRALLLCLAVALAGAAQAHLFAEPGHGGTAAVIARQDGSEAEVTALGRAVRGEDGPLTEDDAWHLGSLTKAMTATLAGRLVADGVLTFDDRIGDRLDAPAPWADVTLAELLTHRSGMAANLPRWRTLLRPGRAAYVAHMLGTAPAAARGAFHYSNAGYVVAAAMMEVATGRRWKDLVRAEVWEPLGMEGMGVGPPFHIRGDGGRAHPRARGSDNVRAMAPAGGAHGPARAMLLFLAAHRDRDPAFLPPEVWGRLQAPFGDYAMGWRADGARLAHLGSNTLWYAGMSIEGDTLRFIAVNDGSDRSAAWVRREIGLAPRATPE